MNLNLHLDQKRLRDYVEGRVRDYPKHKNIGPGDPSNPIRRVTFGFYAEQGGYVNLIFDTRPDAAVDGQWTRYIEEERNTLAFPDWTLAYNKIFDGHGVSVTRHDGTSCELRDSDGDEGVNRVFGEMIVDLMVQLREDGTLRKLPLASGARMDLEEFDGRYSWPRQEKGFISP